MSFYSITMVICSLTHEETGDEAQVSSAHGYNLSKYNIKEGSNIQASLVMFEFRFCSIKRKNQ